MMKFEWNALRPGDKVLVHDAGAATLALTSGVVTTIDAHKDTNGVGVRVASGEGNSRILWPMSRAVHRDPRTAGEPCWRCEAVAAG
jgi:hypothetical protein